MKIRIKSQNGDEATVDMKIGLGFDREFDRAAIEEAFSRIWLSAATAIYEDEVGPEVHLEVHCRIAQIGCMWCR